MNNGHNQSLLPSLYTTCVLQLTLNHFYQKEMEGMCDVVLCCGVRVEHIKWLVGWI